MMSRLFLVGVGLASATQVVDQYGSGEFQILYYTDGNCTNASAYIGTPAGSYTGGHYGIVGPMDACLNTTGLKSALQGSFKAFKVVDCNAQNFTTLYAAEESCAATASGLYPNGGCIASSLTPGLYFAPKCDTSKVFVHGESVAATAYTLTTTHAPLDDGSFLLKYYTDSGCTTAANISDGTMWEISGRMGQCLNTTAAGSPVSAMYRAAKYHSCNGVSAIMDINMGTLPDGASCPTTGMVAMPVTVNSCTFSSSTGMYFMSTCNSTISTASSSYTITTTHAPLNEGSFLLKYYTDNVCTVAANVSDGTMWEIGGPAGKCLNTTAMGTPVNAMYRAANFHSCNGATATMDINMGTLPDGASCPTTGMVAMPVTVNSCTFSSSTGMYYYTTCNSTMQPASSFTITTTHAPISNGTFMLKYFMDSACQTAANISDGTMWEITGPMSTCLDTVKAGSPVSAMYKSANYHSCNGATATMDINMGAASCPSTGMTPMPVAVNVCSFSSSTGMYFLSTCTSTAWSGADHSVTVSDTVTTVAATTVTATSTGSGEAATTVAGATEAPTATVSASYSATEDLPAGTTATDLMASTPYLTAKKEGLATALSVTAAKVTVTAFTIARRRLAEKGRKLATMTVDTAYSVEVPETAAATMETAVQAGTLATAIQTATATAMAAQDWSSEPILSAAPTVTVANVAYVGTVTAAPAATPAATSAAASLGAFSVASLVASFMLF